MSAAVMPGDRTDRGRPSADPEVLAGERGVADVEHAVRVDPAELAVLVPRADRLTGQLDGACGDVLAAEVIGTESDQHTGLQTPDVDHSVIDAGQRHVEAGDVDPLGRVTCAHHA